MQTFAHIILLQSFIRHHDKAIYTIFEAIRQLMKPPNPPRKKIGFIEDDDK